MRANLHNLGKLQKLVMNYKLSNRELMLIKLLAAIGLITIFIYGTSYLASEINKSKEYLFIEVNKFNEKPARYIARNVEINPTGIVTAGIITPVKFPKNR